GDSPNNEAESPQDIIWDTNSPTQNLNGHGDVRVIEISEIVSRIAPKVSIKLRDSVLQWIGDGAIPCTPEIRQPRVRRISARQNNVEDLMKLAKQFDINMTRQDKEKQHESTEKRNQLSKLQSDGTTTPERSTSVKFSSEQLTSCSSQAHQEEAELQVLFDGPTQHISGRLSPPSVNCTEPVAQAEQKSSSAAIKNPPADAPKATKVDFDDDWENDDLLHDSFVLEMTQNAVPLSVAQKPSPTSPVDQVKQQTHSSQDSRQVELNRMTKDCGVSSQTTSAQLDGVSEEDMKSLFDSDALWNEEADDVLLCQACDDLEKISTVRTHSATVGNASNTHHYTFKRHLSDSMTLTNKGKLCILWHLQNISSKIASLNTPTLDDCNRLETNSHYLTSPIYTAQNHNKTFFFLFVCFAVFISSYMTAKSPT
uniref:Si:dkey-78p8.1 n=1 Tax=Cyprinus carpio carpio TaxID=630221 RepID=A0A9J7XFF4_CYPCA